MLREVLRLTKGDLTGVSRPPQKKKKVVPNASMGKKIAVHLRKNHELK